ncbi:ferredoxin [Solihabitans fulvus]|uniref:Ferredoxin n=1 Tax=Solihabitans fulvus TaxID=1892852 RepID=A0A5B2XQW1_9PSEU|nr:ferredoxin [Solihabitans fulvus]
MRISVHNGRCHRYGVCQAEAPEVFQLDQDGRLRYEARPDADQAAQVRMAARCCPMQAIDLRGDAR